MGPLCHKSKVVKNFLEYKNILLLDWSRNWPDLNLSENLWTLLIKKMSGKQPASQKSLVTAIKELWTKETFYEYFKRLLVKVP